MFFFFYLAAFYKIGKMKRFNYLKWESSNSLKNFLSIYIINNVEFSVFSSSYLRTLKVIKCNKDSGTLVLVGIYIFFFL